MSYPIFSQKLSFVCGYFLLLCSILRADTVILKSGGSIKNCRVVRKDSETVHLRTPSGSMGVPKQDILRIEPQKSIFDTYDEMRARVRDNDANGLFRLAQWCRKTTGLREEMEKLLNKVIALNKNHVQARQILGYIRVGKTWKKPKPLALYLKIPDKMEMAEVLRNQLSISLNTRKDLRFLRKSQKSNTLDFCELLVSISSGTSSTSRFFGLKLKGQVRHSTINIKAKGKWIGKTPLKVVLKGEVPTSTPDASRQALIDAVTRNYQELQKFYDSVSQLRLKKLQLVADRKQEKKKQEQKTKKK